MNAKGSLILEPQFALFTPTHITAESKFTFRILSTAKTQLHYQWRSYPTDDEELDAISDLDLQDANDRNKARQLVMFHSQVFRFENKENLIWPGQYVNCIAYFHPNLSVKHDDTAYLYVMETGERIPFRLQGTGLSPEAKFSVSSINVGHVTLDSVMEYEVFLENTGEVICDFSLTPKTVQNLIFEFTPSSGHIEIGEKVPIRIKFTANYVGQFTETFEFHIKGVSQNHPTIGLYGRVVGPTFSIDVARLDFGKVSYGFLYTKTFEISNKSEIPFDYSLALSHDGSFSRREFSISPQTGLIGKFSKQIVTIEFIPMKAHDYNLQLIFNIDKFGEKMATIPISAECISPNVYLVKDVINLGNIFIGAEYRSKLQFKDDTDLPAKYEYIPATDSSMLQANITVSHPNGVINAHTTTDMDFVIVPKQLGPLDIVQHIRFFGNENPPLPFTIKGTVTGPNIQFSQDNINFGRIQVLKDVSHQVVITNNSQINASFTATVECDGENFRIEPSEGYIQAGGQFPVKIIAQLDDTVEFKGKVVFRFDNLNPLYINLKALGTGSTIVPSIPMTSLDLGNIFTEVPSVKKFTLTNKGRRNQELRFSIQKPKLSSSEGVKFSCTITPEVQVLAPGQESKFTLSVQSDKTISFTDGIMCHATVGKQRQEIFTLYLKGTFVKPFISFNKNVVQFTHIHDAEKEEELTGKEKSSKNITPPPELLPILKNDFEINNASKLPLTVRAECPVPFSISETTFVLDAGQKKKLTVTFDPTFKEDYSCETVNKRIVFTYKEHPQVSTLNLQGSLIFPNIVFKPDKKIDFGILLYNTEQSKDVTMQNPTDLPVDFVWELFPDGNGVDVKNIFDIYPIRGHIEPKSSDTVHISFFSQMDSEGRSTTFQGRAVCHVIGGPDYTMKLVGGSANIQYKLDPVEMDLGDIGYLDNINTSVTLTNCSDVPLNFAVKIPKGTAFTTFVVTPTEGTIQVNAFQKFNIIMTPGLPREFDETFFIRIGHFDEARVNIRVNCFIPQCKLSLPRHEADPLMVQYHQKFDNKKLKNIRRKDTLALTSTATSMGEEEDEEDVVEQLPTDQELAEIEKQLLIQKLTNKQMFDQSTLRRRRQKGEPVPVYEGYVASRFILDMGKIVFGKKETYKFTIMSMAPSPISFELVTKELNDTGFMIEPTSFKDVKPNEPIEVLVTFDIKKKRPDLNGDVEFTLPLLFNIDYAYIIFFRAKLQKPTLNLSQTHFDFGTTIVGQTYTMTLQLQNMNTVPVEFKFSDAQYSNVLQRSIAKDPGFVNVFTATPSFGCLPPVSFQNIDISFLPIQEKNYSMQFPIDIKYNNQTVFVTLKGQGVQLKVTFDPPELHLPPILPFSDPSQIQVKMVNPTGYPIEVIATQFDLQLLIEEESAKRNMILDNSQNISDTEILGQNPPQAPQTPAVSKFSICVIVHGSSGSGRTTISNLVSKYLGNVPIISCKSLWQELLKQTDPAPLQADFVSTFSDRIMQPDCANGFVIDGLDGLPENDELEQFYTHCLKTKNIWDEVLKNPFTQYQHQALSAAEQALSYILAALDGHYVFMVALHATEDVLNDRKDAMASQERRRKRHEAAAEKVALFKMSEEDYLKLTDEERQAVDKKRESYRRRMLKQAIESDAEKGIINADLDILSSRRRSSSHRSSKDKGEKKERRESSAKDKGEKKEKSPNKEERRKHSKDKRSSSTKGDKEEKEPKDSSRREKDSKDPRRRDKDNGLKSPKGENPDKKKIRSLKAMPTDPIQRDIIIFTFTLGTIVQRLKDGGEQFAAIDPHDIMKESAMPSAMASKMSLPPFEPVALGSVTPNSKSKSQVLDDNLVQPVMSALNCLLLESGANKPEEANTFIMEFIPQINQLKEKAFTRLIPAARITLPDPSTLMKATLSQMPKYFSIVVEEPFTPEQINTQHVMRPDSTTKSGRKSRTRRDRSNEPLFAEDYDLSKRTPVWKIEPNSSQILTIQFDAQLAGSYKDNIIFQLINGRSDLTKLRVVGTCAYPDITRDLKLLFPKRVARLDNKTEMAFVADQQQFYFGSLLVVKDRNPKAPPAYRQAITLTNPSLFPVELSAFLMDTPPKSPWVIEKPTLTIEPGQNAEFSFGIHPTQPDIYHNTVIFFIKDHPEPFTFQMGAEGCVPTIDINNFNLEFEKLLLNQTKTLSIDLKNTGKIPAAWRLKGQQQLGNNFTFNCTEGLLNPRGSFTITVVFTSNKPLAVKKAIQIEILDKDNAHVFSSKNINISAEAFDVNFDFQYPKGMDHLQFGMMKVSQQKSIAVTLKNKGKYPSLFKITVTGLKIQKLFTITPNEGTLNSNDKPLSINFTFTSPRLVSYANAKGLALVITDSLTNTVTATLPLPFSAQTVYSSFIINPTGTIDFGALSTNEQLTKQITIENNGSFPFEYDIQPKPEPVDPKEMQTTKGKKKAPAKPATPTRKVGRGKEKSVLCGNYIIVPSQQVVPPGQKVSIDIDFQSATDGTFDSTALISITDVDTTKTPGPIPISFHATVHTPAITTHDFEKIFVGTMLSLRCDISKNPQTAFLEDEQLLYFAARIIGQKAEVPMCLTNPLPIPCTVDITLKPNAKGKAALQNFPFDVNEKSVTIGPNGKYTVNLSFLPTLTDKFLATAECVVRGNANGEGRMLKFGLEGTGTLPAISVVGEKDKPGKNGVIAINLGKTLIGFTKEKTICLANDGMIPAKLAISAKASPDFELNNVDSAQEFILDPGHKFNLPIVYSPQKVRKGQFDINVAVIDNPKSNVSLSITAEGFSEDVIFEGLQEDESDLYFRDNVVGRQQQATFVMHNVSQNHIKFNWPAHADFSFSPRVGHLRMGQRKTITVTFFTDKPVKHNGVKISCQWQKIEFANPNAHDWDDSMKVIKFVTKGSIRLQELAKEQALKQEQAAKSKGPKSPNSSKKQIHEQIEPLNIPDPTDNEIVKVVEIKPEPENTPQPQKCKDLVLRVFAISDYIKYHCDTQDISFSPTMMYQKRSYEVKLTNTSGIRFEYTWAVEDFKAIRTASQNVPFSVIPSTGFIDAGSSTTFSVNFEPEEVDDFTAKLVCQIPYLSQMEPPAIIVSGLSRRPLCHFNVEMSDYISAGRRHPDYTDVLPEDIRVVELFSTGIGKRATKKFEVINPTASSYEVNWSKVGAQNAKDPIVCDTPAALVSSGKRYMVAFSYLPTSSRIVESQWDFHIPEHGVTVHFLIVGRIVPTK